jgi:excisionase family DNA binding protein
MPEPRTTLTTTEAAEYMNVPERMVRDLCSSGYLDAEKVGRSWQISAESVQQWIDKPIVPHKPFYLRSWFIGLAAIVALLAGLFGILADSDMRDKLYDTFASAPFSAAQEGETLIVIATFHRPEGIADYDIDGEIKRAIKDQLELLELNNIRVEVEPTAIETDNQEMAESLGKKYNATLIIWGADTGARVEVNFLNLEEPKTDGSNINISETERSQIAAPDAYAISHKLRIKVGSQVKLDSLVR